MQLPNRHPRWSKSERHLYGGQSVRVMGEVDRAGNLLVMFMSGELDGEGRWMSAAELNSDATQSAETAPGSTEQAHEASGTMNGQETAAAAKNESEDAA
jgi:hypothetical protein